MSAALDNFRLTVGQHAPALGVVLGSGLGVVPHRFEEIASLPFADVPGLAAPSVHGHSGRICLGRCAGRPMLVLRGRLHFYEGRGWDRVAGPIHLLAELGVRTVLLTNAAGGIHPALNPGDLMLLAGHLFLQMPNAWKQPAETDIYSDRVNHLLQAAETREGRTLRSGIYAAVTGPCYETPAEIRALRTLGADAVGMSTAHEAATARRLGLEVAAISCITNKAAGLTGETLSHADVLATASRPAERISALIERLLLADS